jgi:copper homeostasis protein
MILEIIATTVEDALAAEKGGADRLELISGLSEGGITPSAALVRRVCGAVSIPVNVMIRVRSGNFAYTAEELSVMVEDAGNMKALGASGLVFGALDGNGRLDLAALDSILEAAKGLPVTFHRAFDAALEAAFGATGADGSARTASALGLYASLGNRRPVARILSSGGASTAIEGSAVLATLVRASAGGGPRILAGAGLSASNLVGLIGKTGVGEVHLGTSVRSIMSGVDRVDEEKVRTVRGVIGSRPA